MVLLVSEYKVFISKIILPVMRVMPGIINSRIHAVRGGLGQVFFCQFPVTISVDQIHQCSGRIMIIFLDKVS